MVICPIGTPLPACRDRGRSTSRATPVRATPRRRSPGVRASDRARSCRILRPIVRIPAQSSSAVLARPICVLAGAEVLLNQIGDETVVTGRNWSVRRENDFARNPAEASSKSDTLLCIRSRIASRIAKSTVAFVQVQHARRRFPLPESAEATDAKQEFLADADTPSPPYNATSGRGLRAHFLRHWSPEEEIDPPDLHAPHLARMSHAGFGLNHDGLAVGSDCRLHRRLLTLVSRYSSHCHPLRRDADGSIPVRRRVLCDQRNPEVGSALDVISGNTPRPPE